MRAPHFWSRDLDPRSREAAPLTRILLTPLAMIYAWATDRRIRTVTPVNVGAKVICIGNLTAGGTGKSPLVQALRTRLSERSDARVATLSRGYGGRLKGPLKVDAELHSAADVGDEPRMLAATGESWIGADRAAAGKAMVSDGVEIILMDDGHQNPALAKDLSILVVDGAAGFGNGYVIPKGPLREQPERGLARADLIIQMGEGSLPDSVKRAGKPLLKAHIRPATDLPPAPYVAFAGIGRPEKFFDTLTELGADLRDAVPFPDHHVYSESDLDYLRRLAGDHGAQLITTEKDLARLGTSERTEGIVSLPVRVEFEDETELDAALGNVLDKRDENGARD